MDNARVIVSTRMAFTPVVAALANVHARADSFDVGALNRAALAKGANNFHPNLP